MISGSVQAGMTEFQYSTIFDAPIPIQAGMRYWLTIENNLPFQMGERWDWEISGDSGSFGVQRFYDGAWHAHAVTGTAFALSTVPEPSSVALVFALISAGLAGLRSKR